MGKPTGFFEYDRKLPARRPVPVRLRDWREVYEPFPEEEAVRQGARCMDCGIPFCHEGCPLGNLIPEWNDLVYRGRLARGPRTAPRHQQLPGVHRATVPRPVRGGVRARHQRRSRRHRAHRVRDRRAGLDRGLGDPAGPLGAHRQVGGGGRVGPGRPGLRPAAGPGRAQRGRLRAGRAPRRAAALRDPGIQDGEGGAGPAPGPAARPRAWCSAAPRRWARAGEPGHARVVGRTARAGRAARARCRLCPRRDAGAGASRWRRSSTPWCWPAAPPRRATFRWRAVTSTACTSPWST